MKAKERAGKNRTITLTESEKQRLTAKLLYPPFPSGADMLNTMICADTFDALHHIPRNSVDLLFVDPPYNMRKKFVHHTFNKMVLEDYAEWMDSWFQLLLPTLKPTASVYVCGDWQNSSAIHHVLAKYLHIHNRITWEREKGRGAKNNWKNSSEDIWFGTVNKDYFFDVDAVKLKRKVMAPYRDASGQPKDWDAAESGNFRLTHPSNLWTDLTVPFWSMPENTDHPTQKPEKLVAKIILASSRPGDVVLDPFAGSGTTAVVAKKLGRNFYAIDMEEDYCCLAQKRLELAELDPAIQGYSQGLFWDRNTLSLQSRRE